MISSFKRTPFVVNVKRNFLWFASSKERPYSTSCFTTFQFNSGSPPKKSTSRCSLLPEFAKALTLADHVVLADIYAARETDNLGISSADLQKQIRELGTPCEYFPTFDEIENFLLENCTQGDLLITMGAGDVVLVGEALIK